MAEGGGSPEGVERERGQGRASPGSVERGVMTPDNPSSEVGSEYDDVDYADEHESEGGDVNFAGVTNDLEVMCVCVCCG